MSKSYGNAIFLSDPPDVIEKKILPMMTDPARKKRTDRGNPELCPVFSLHKVYSSKETMSIVDENCRSAGFGCIDCKKLLIPSIVRDLEPIRMKRADQEKKPHLVRDVVEQGSARARKVVQDTMADARKAIGLIRWMDIG
jgi:tryptophanyl-tRNA synthetase